MSTLLQLQQFYLLGSLYNQTRQEVELGRACCEALVEVTNPCRNESVEVIVWVDSCLEKDHAYNVILDQLYFLDKQLKSKGVLSGICSILDSVYFNSGGYLEFKNGSAIVVKVRGSDNGK